MKRVADAISQMAQGAMRHYEGTYKRERQGTRRSDGRHLGMLIGFAGILKGKKPLDVSL
ncbi:MAG TPA: hypothetical protein VNF02_05950 [Candidatus Limnocylindrales bacterium]|nr:hypothetical protein [Candidatus Limnocylindrales bacterium]